jgi:hypothetical protein
MEWTFLQTFPDYDKLQEFRHKNKCQLCTSKEKDEKALRVRYSCPRRKRMNNCEFMLLARKTTKEGYHVYKYGEHNHPAIESRGKHSRQRSK